MARDERDPIHPTPNSSAVSYAMCLVSVSKQELILRLRDLHIVEH